MVTYDFYLGVYNGCSICAGEWPAFEARAVEQLARYKRIYTVMASEKNSEALAACAMADALAYFSAVQNGTGGVVSSASIGSVSVSYGGSAGCVDMSVKGQERELMRCARLYLDIYRGVG